MNRPVRALPFLLATLASTAVVHAAETVVPETIAQATIEETLRAPLARRGATAVVQVATPDARRNLAPCAKATGFVPSGARLVGRTMVGVRCTEGATWQAFVGVDVHVTGPVWTAARALRPGDRIGTGDLASVVGPLSGADFEPTGRGLATLDGRMPAPIGSTMQRASSNGRALVQADVRQVGRVDAGEAVRVVYRGDGFAVSAEGKAVGAADPGSVLLVRLASGSLVNGTLRDDRKVEIQQ